jgi:hypothetical protein
MKTRSLGRRTRIRTQIMIQVVMTRPQMIGMNMLKSSLRIGILRVLIVEIQAAP